MNLYVANIPYALSEAEMRELFEKYGTVSSAKIVMDRETNRSRGFGFVEMPDDNAAKEAISGLNGTQVKGRALTVNEARPREDKGDRPRRGPRY